MTEPSPSLDHQSLVTVASRPDEPSAQMLVAVLQDAGIRAIAVGGFTAGFRAEAPGWVRVQVMQPDAAEATRVIGELRPV